MTGTTAKLGKRGTVVIPAEIRRRFGLEEGSLLLVEPGDQGVLLRPAMAVPVEMYSTRRKAEFLLENAVDEDDYARAAAEVRSLGLDPADIPHDKP